MAILLDEAKAYLRVDSDDEDTLIAGMIESAKQICMDIIRVDETIYPESSPVVHIAMLYTLGYLYEHREEADHHELNETLRHLLQGERRPQF